MKKMYHIEHSQIEFYGLEIRDTEHEKGDAIWVGYGGMDGVWMSADEVREFAALLLKVADAHNERLTLNARKYPIAVDICPE